MKVRLLLWVSCLFASLILTSPLWGQLPTATLNGIVIDPKDAVVAGGRVVATNKATGVIRETSTGAEGRYVLVNLPAATYDIRIEAQGFTPREFKDVRLEVGKTTTLDVKLSLPAVGTTITVEAGPGAVELTQSIVQGQISDRTVENIPLNGRNFLELAFLIPGNRPATNYDPTKTNTLEVSSAGQFGRGGNITVDGGDNNDEVVGGTLANFPEDSIKEFQIATNRYTAEVGRSGSSIINIVSKSGSNEYHGSGFFFLRNRNLQGLPATFDRTQPTPPFDRQQYGGSVGGPIVKEKAWWFFSVENRHQNASVQTGTRNFATSNVDVTSASAPLRDVLLSARADYKVGQSDTIYGRYSFNRSTETDNGSLRRALGSAANRQDSFNRFNSVLASWTHTFSGTKVNTLTFHYDKFLNRIPAFPVNKPTTVPDFGLTNEIRFPRLQDGANFRIPQQTRMDRPQIRDSFAWTRAKHTLLFGSEFQNFGSDILFDLFGSGTIVTTENFATQNRRLGTSCSLNPCDDRDVPIAAVVRSTAAVRPPTAPDDRSSYFGFYVQDDWRVRSNLTLNLGLRYEFDTDIFGTDSDLHGACPTPLTTPPNRPCIFLANILGKAGRSADFKDFGPRIGFAWDPFKKGKTSVRGGYGIYYDRVVLEVKLLETLVDGRRLSIGALNGSTCHLVGTTTAQDCSAPNSVFDTGTPTLATPFVGSSSALAIGRNYLDNRIAHPYVQQFSLGVQQELARNWIVSADGIHNFGTRFLMGRLLRDASNRPVSITDPLTSLADNVTLISPQAKSWYDGLLVAVQRRPARIGRWGYGFNVNYTLSKSFSYANDDQIPFQETGQADVIMGGNNLRLEKGYAATDERHRFVFFGVFEMPFDFTLSPIWTVTSSVPADTLIPLGARLPILPRNALGRDIQNGNQLLAAIDRWNALPPCTTGTPPVPTGAFPCDAGSFVLTAAQRSQISALTFGDTFNSLDMRLTKSFKLAERHKVELIGEVFNLANKTNIRGRNNQNYSGHGIDITSVDAVGNSLFYQKLRTAGGFFGSGGPRAFQFAVRYSF